MSEKKIINSWDDLREAWYELGVMERPHNASSIATYTELTTHEPRSESGKAWQRCYHQFFPTLTSLLHKEMYKRSSSTRDKEISRLIGMLEVTPLRYIIHSYLGGYCLDDMIPVYSRNNTSKNSQLRRSHRKLHQVFKKAVGRSLRQSRHFVLTEMISKLPPIPKTQAEIDYLEQIKDIYD
jgi:hypothetical protein